MKELVTKKELFDALFVALDLINNPDNVNNLAIKNITNVIDLYCQEWSNSPEINL